MHVWQILFYKRIIARPQQTTIAYRINRIINLVRVTGACKKCNDTAMYVTKCEKSNNQH